MRIIQPIEIPESQLNSWFNIIISHFEGFRYITLFVRGFDTFHSHMTSSGHDPVFSLSQKPFEVHSFVFIEHAFLPVS